MWMYDPDFCEGHFCPKDCDGCPWADEVLEKEGENGEEGE